MRWLVRVGVALAVAFTVALAGWNALRRGSSAGVRQKVVGRLVRDPEVVEAARRFSRERGVPLAEALRLAGEYAREIVPSPDARLFFRVGVPLARMVVRFLYGDRLRSGGEEHVPKGDRAGVVFVINHRSNLDYVVLGHLLGGRTALSFAAGEWARFWPLGPLVRAMGSFFVRRGSGDELYRRVLERFVQLGLEEGLTPAVFVEGGLSRDGLLREPKTGILDYALRSFDPPGARDLLFVPVAINHDWVLEDGSLPSPGEPNPSGPRSVLSTVLFIVRAGRMAWRGPEHLGVTAVRFGAPVSAGEWARARNVDFRLLEPEARILRIREFAEDLMRSIGGLVPVVPVPVVASVLLEAPEQALSRGGILARSRALNRDLERNGAWTCLDADEEIVAALRLLVLRRLVVRDGENYRAAPEGTKLLRYYAASISHHM